MRCREVLLRGERVRVFRALELVWRRNRAGEVVLLEGRISLSR